MAIQMKRLFHVCRIHKGVIPKICRWVLHRLNQMKKKDRNVVAAIKGKSFFCSWSGGKDSCLALYRAIQHGGRPKYLLTMMTEGNERSRSHGLPTALILQQAQALGIPLIVRATSWNDYENTFLSALREFTGDGVEFGVFGDIDLEPHLEWVERVCSSVGVRVYEPLWKMARRNLLDEFFQLGFNATIVAVKQDVLDNSFLGRSLTKQVVDDLVKAGVDASGEGGEYHTVVTGGPIFSHAIAIEQKEQILRDGYCFLNVS